MKLKLLAMAFTLFAVSTNARATMIMDKGGWNELSHPAQMGYLQDDTVCHLFVTKPYWPSMIKRMLSSRVLLN